MKTNHTPGPWTVNPYSFIHAGKTLIACPATPEEAQAGLCAHPESEEAKANARLIAAAPDLLAACKSALAALTQNKTYPADIKLAVGNLSLAIDKATMEPA